MRFAYPVMLDVTDRLVVIIGGGAVAVRKVKTLLDAGATRVRVVAPAFHEQMPAAVERVGQAYRPEHLEGAELAFAVTDSAEMNDRIVRDARSRRVPVNRGDEGEVAGDFVVPASFQSGEVVVGVAAGSPALAVVIRDKLRREVDERHVAMANQMRDLRPIIRNQPALPPARRAMLFRDLATEEAFATLAESGAVGLRAWISSRYPEVDWSV